MTTTDTPLEAVDLVRTFPGPAAGHARVTAVDHVSLNVASGSMTAIVGPSGSGKSTLLQLLAGLDRPDSGSVRIGGVELTTLRDRALTAMRRERIGFIFQSYQLLPQLTAEQNIDLPLRLAGRVGDTRDLHDLADLLGIGDRLDHLPGQLSGGQRQRVAIARALITRPDVVLADEPTGALDGAAAQGLIELFKNASRDLGQTIVAVTHDERLAAHADRVLRMDSGQLIESDTPALELV